MSASHPVQVLLWCQSLAQEWEKIKIQESLRLRFSGLLTSERTTLAYVSAYVFLLRFILYYSCIYYAITPTLSLSPSLTLVCYAQNPKKNPGFQDAAAKGAQVQVGFSSDSTRIRVD